MKRGLSLTLPSLKPSEGLCGQRRPGEGVVVAGCRLGTGRAAEVAVRGGVVELQVEGLFSGVPPSLRGDAVEGVGLVVAGQAVERREGAAEVVRSAVFARFPAAGVADTGRSSRAVVVERVAVVVVVGVGVEDGVPGVPAGRHVGPVVVRRVAVAVEELADVDRPVAGALQPGRDVVAGRRRGLEAGVAAFGRDVAAVVVVVGVTAGQEADPRGAAERSRRRSSG